MVRGDREQEDHVECLWDLMRSIPSLEVENASVLDEFYWLQKDDPHRSLRRMTQNRGEAVPTDGKYGLSSRAQREINLLSITRDEDLYDKRMKD
jgi:oleate hydratase